MADSTVAITAGSGTPIRVLTGLGAGSGDQQVVTPGDQYGNLSGRVYGPVKVSQEEQTLFLDTHDLALDTVNRWITPTGANAPSVSSSVLSFGVATTVSAFGKLTSLPSFAPQIPGFLQPSFSLKADPAGAAAISGHRFWGVGTSPTTPATTSAGTKLTDAIGFEIDTDGKMYAVVYASGGTRTAIDLSSTGTGAAQSTQPLDGLYHRYLIQIRTDRIYWFIDSTSFYVASMSFTAPNSQTLPILFQTINPASSVAGGGYPLSIQGSVVADTASNSSQISDGIYPWRKAKITAQGEQKVASGAPSVVQKQSAVSTGSVSTLTATYPSLNTQGNTLVVCIGVGNVTAPTVSDSQGNTYTLAAATSLTGEGTAMYYAVNCRPGANTVTATNAGAAASMAMEVYELTNVYADAPVDITISSSGTSAAPGVVVTPASATNVKWSNTLIIECIGVGTAAQTVTVPALFTNDSGQLNPTTPAGLFSFVSVSRQMAGFTTVAAGSMTSEPWSAILVAFRPAPVFIDGVVRVGDGTQNAMVKASSTAAVAADTALVVAVSPNNTVPVNAAPPAVGTTGDTGSKNATFNGATQTNTNAKGVWVTINVGTVTGTTPTMVCKLQVSSDAGTTFVDVPGATTATITATGVYGILCYPGVAVTAGVATTGTSAQASSVIGRTWRVVYTITGTSPVFPLTAVNTQPLQ